MSPPLFVASIMLASSAVAGCISQGIEPTVTDGPTMDPNAREPGGGMDRTMLSESVYGMLPKEIAYVAASLDNIQLYAEVYLPDGEGPWPAILVSSPYHIFDHAYEPARNAIGDPIGDFVRSYVGYGYAMVFADVRGTGNSEGCMNMMGAKEQQDQYDLVEWIAAQPWSDTKVGMWGVSYVGTTPHEAAITAPPHLVTVATVAGVTNQWRNTFQNGVPYDGRAYPIVYEAGFGLPPPLDVGRGPAWAANVAQGACEQEEAVQAMSPGVYEKGVYNAYWVERNLTLGAAAVTVPVFYSQGFRDRAVNPMEAIHWFNELDVPKKAFFHQDFHQLPPRDDWDDALHAWFDHWLKGIDNGIMDTPTVEVLTNLDTFRLDDEWPPRDAQRLRFYLAPESLVAEPPEGGGASYLADMARDPLTFGLQTDDVLDAAIMAALDEPTWLAFVSEPLVTDVHMAGAARMTLVGSVNAENTYWLLDLYDVEGDEWTWLAEGWFNAHLWEGFDHSAPLTPDEPYTFRFKFEPREYVFETGHSIGMRIEGHDGRVFPIDQSVTLNTVYFGGDAPSFVELPVLANPIVYERPDGV